MCTPLFRGSLKRGRQQRLHLLSQVHSTSPHGKAGLFSPPILNPRTVADCGEHALIARIRQRLTTPQWVVVGPGDDAAAIEPVRGALEVVTTDAQVEGVHFDRRFVPPDAIGHRALAVNLSDLAAMGARPRAALLSMALPSVARARCVRSASSMACSRWRLATVWRSSEATSRTRSGPMVLDVTALGNVHRRKMLTRDGARAATRSMSPARSETPRPACCGFRKTTSASEQPAGICGPIRECEPGLLLGRNRRPRAAWTSAMDWRTVSARSRRPHRWA